MGEKNKLDKVAGLKATGWLRLAQMNAREVPTVSYMEVVGVSHS